MSVTQADDAIVLIEGASSPVDVFGEGDPGPAYRRLAKLVHPDRHMGDDRARRRAEAAFAKLSALYVEATGTTSPTTLIVTTKRRSYVVCRAHEHAGDIANLYRCSWLADAEGDPDSGLLKMPRSPRSNDLMQREAQTLRRLSSDGDEQLRAFAPVLHGTVRHRDTTSGVERRCNVLPYYEDWYSLAEVHEAFPLGLDGRDAAWMWRRLLAALALAHGAGVVHGAPWPEHVLIHPEMHGLVLIDWCYSTEVGSPLRALSPHWAKKYPAEVTAGEAATEATDVSIASHTMASLLDRRARALRSFARGCTLERESMRPHSALDLMRELDELLERQYGPRKFRPFAMPTNNRKESAHG